jgi:hypothetical protein
MFAIRTVVATGGRGTVTMDRAITDGIIARISIVPIIPGRAITTDTAAGIMAADLTVADLAVAAITAGTAASP